MSQTYDVIIVGAGIAGASLGTSLGKQGKKVLVLERDMREPDTFRGELLQHGGIQKLKELGLDHCIEGIDGQKCYGYVVYRKGAEQGKLDEVVIDFPKTVSSDGIEKKCNGLSFHHGKFVTNLRKELLKAPNVTVLEATVLSLIEEGEDVLGVTYRLKDSDDKIEARSNLTVDCSGSFSKFRKGLIANTPTYNSHFVALLLKNCQTPHPDYGYVTLADPAPVLCYAIATGEMRMLVAVPDPLPSNSNGELKKFMESVIYPQLPEFMKAPFMEALNEPLRSVPCQKLPPCAIRRPGAICVGDSFNMRHPLTGGGMTVAFTDVSIIVRILSKFNDLSDRKKILKALNAFYTERVNTASTINILAQALYDVFCGSQANEAMGPVRDACFDYFPNNGTYCLALLNGFNPSPLSLTYHFFSVAALAAWKLQIGRAHV